MNCPNCGHATPPTHAARCGHCNFKLPFNPKPQASTPVATLPCWNCRHPNAAGAERCEHCNAKLQAVFTGKTNSKPKRASLAGYHPENQPLSNISSHDE